MVSTEGAGASYYNYGRYRDAAGREYERGVNTDVANAST